MSKLINYNIAPASGKPLVYIKYTAVCTHEQTEICKPENLDYKLKALICETARKTIVFMLNSRSSRYATYSPYTCKLVQQARNLLPLLHNGCDAIKLAGNIINSGLLEKLVQLTPSHKSRFHNNYVARLQAITEFTEETLNNSTKIFE